MHSEPTASAPSSMRHVADGAAAAAKLSRTTRIRVHCIALDAHGNAISSTSTGVFMVFEMPLAIVLMPSLFGRAPKPPLIVS